MERRRLAETAASRRPVPREPRSARERVSTRRTDHDGTAWADRVLADYWRIGRTVGR